MIEKFLKAVEEDTHAKKGSSGSMKVDVNIEPVDFKEDKDAS